MGGTKPKKQKTKYKVIQYILYKKGQKKLIDRMEEIEAETIVEIDKPKKEDL
mgnify:CR=1 FL=1